MVAVEEVVEEEEGADLLGIVISLDTGVEEKAMEGGGSPLATEMLFFSAILFRNDLAA